MEPKFEPVWLREFEEGSAFVVKQEPGESLQEVDTGLEPGPSAIKSEPLSDEEQPQTPNGDERQDPDLEKEDLEAEPGPSDTTDKTQEEMGEELAVDEPLEDGASTESHKCIICRKCFGQRSTLETHLLSHCVRCQICGKHFPQRGSLKRHLLIHTGRREHECADCGKRFLHRCHLQKHLLIHTKEKDFECTDCGKRFSHRGNLKSHFQIHLKE